MESNFSRPKISVLMPVYNVKDYLRAAVESVLNQTLPDIELICVDDASTDGSADILREYAARDSRIKLVFHEKNRGLVAARKSATDIARGEYIMLLDSDDAYAPTACETVWKEEQADPVDILQFGTDIVFCGSTDPVERQNVLRAFAPYKPFRGDLVTAAFEQHLWNHTLWNKAYKASVWKQGLAWAGDAYINASEDEYLYFLVAYHARRYRGISAVLYTYYLGRGLTGQSHLTCPQFGAHCRRRKAYDGIDAFLRTVKAQEALFSVCRAMRASALSALAQEWFSYVSVSDARQAYDVFVETWGAADVISQLADSFWDRADEVISRIAPGSLPVEEKAGVAVRTIGIYYYRLTNGGVERVISLLIPIWLEMGYQVVLITEDPPSDREYPIPPQVKRARIPTVQEATRTNYRKRALAWQSVIRTCGIDTIVYAAHVCDLLMWDLCLIKALGCNAILHSHTTYSFLYLEKLPNRYLLPHAYRIADRIVTLSRVYSEYWGNFCPAYYIPNPLEALCPAGDLAPLNGQNILWVGRLSAEKQPYDALRIFALVKSAVPHATLTVVGAGETPEALSDLKEFARQENLADSVFFEGFHKDVTPYYAHADVLLFTSQYEGFPMVLLEAKSYGLPTVLYDLPYLEMVRDRRGVVTAPQGDIQAMADALAGVLTQDSRRFALGKQARQSAEAFAAVDQKEKWGEVFSSLEHPCGKAYITSEQERMMLNLLLDSDQKSTAGHSHGAFTALEDRLIRSKFMQIAAWYWKHTDPLKERIKRIRKRVRR